MILSGVNSELSMCLAETSPELPRASCSILLVFKVLLTAGEWECVLSAGYGSFLFLLAQVSESLNCVEK